MSTISSVGNQSTLQHAAKTKASDAVQPTRAKNTVKNDGDADDLGGAPSTSKAPAAAPKAVTNTMGQLIGKTVDVQA